MSYFGNINWDDHVALGLIPGWKGINKFGRTTNADNAIPTDLWAGAHVIPQPIWLQPTVAQVMNVVSSSADDDSVGTGLRTCRLFGLKTWDSTETSEDIVLNGVTPVSTVNTYVMVNEIKGLTFGSTLNNVGNITCTGATDARTVALIDTGKNITHLAVFSLPRGKTFLVKNMVLSVLGADTIRADAGLLVKENADLSTSAFEERFIFPVRGGGPFSFTPSPPDEIIGPAIVKMQTLAATNNQTIAGVFSGSLVDN